VFLGALCAAAAVLLIVAGLAKIRTPAPAAAMIVLLRPAMGPLRRASRAVRCAGVVEVGVGLAALAVGSRLALALLTACYLALTVVAVRLATGEQRAPCGCFGAADGTVGRVHVLFDVVCLAVCGVGMVRPPGPVTALFGDGVLVGMTVVAQTVLLAALGYLSITALPALSAVRRDPPTVVSSGQGGQLQPTTEGLK
jgi:hypothetical protein